MIAALNGKLLEKQANSAIIDVGGVGYEVAIPLSVFYKLGDLGSDVSLRVYTHVREDAIQLYGFSDTPERSLFLKLIAVSGIGPKLAITMLSGMSAEEIAAAVQSGNLAAISSIPGIGKKTAERLVVDLRDKLSEFDASGGDQPVGSISVDESVLDDAVSALVNLGYHQKAASKAVRKAASGDEEVSVQQLLKKSLQLLAKN